jgi:glycosyltransferase involved in cell wall biosynthesis
VRFLGQRDDVPAVVGASDMLVLASAREGLPRCLLEAMSMGVPVIASTARGSRDLLAEGRGLLFPVGDVGALAAAIGETLRDAQSAHCRAERARAWVADHAELDRVVEAHVALYEAALRGQSVAALPAGGERSPVSSGQRLASAA